MASSKAEALAAFKRVKDPTQVNVHEVVGERKLPEWIGRFQSEFRVGLFCSERGPVRLLRVLFEEITLVRYILY